MKSLDSQQWAIVGIAIAAVRGGPEIRVKTASEETGVRLLLVRKFADRVDGVDLSGHLPGDVLTVPPHDAALLIAEGWAVRYEEEMQPLPAMTSWRAQTHAVLPASVAAIGDFCHAALSQPFRRRAEDRIREQLRDERARTITAEPDPWEW